MRRHLISRRTDTRVAMLLGCAAVALLSAPSAWAQSSQPSPYAHAYRYDGANRPIGEIAPDPDGDGPIRYTAKRTRYNALGLPVSIETGVLAAWQPSSVAPNDWPNFTVRSTQHFAYNTMNKLERSWTVMANGATVALTQTNFDREGRPSCTAVRMNLAAYGGLPANACHQGAAGTDGPDRITRNFYNVVGQLERVRKGVGTDLEQDYATYGYSPNGKQTSLTDANGNRAEMRYDGHDRQIAWVFPSKVVGAGVASCNIGAIIEVDGITGPTGTMQAGDDCEKYAYDRNGNRAKLIKRDGMEMTFEYDGLNRMMVKRVPERGGLDPRHTRDVFYGYDLRGLQLHARFDSHAGEGVTNGYNGVGELVSSTTAMGGVSRTLTYGYDAGGNRSRIAHPDGAFFRTGYDRLNRLVSANWNDTTPFLTIAYDALGRRRNVTRGSSHTGYTYDDVSRLVNQDQRFASGWGNLTSTFGYNPAGQMVSRTSDKDSYAFNAYVNGERGYAVNGLNQYTGVGPNAHGYDANGNLTSDGNHSYQYDSENRLVGSSRSGVALTYDPLGRLWQTASAGQGRTQFLYDGDQLAAEYDGDTGAMRWRYMFAGQDEPILAAQGGALGCPGTQFLHTDHQGSVVAQADCSGARTAVNRYDEFGNPGTPGTRPTGRFRYTGQAWIEELGMYHYKARIYSPDLGRFLQTDPIGYEDQVNLYAYVENDPVINIDPDGTCGGPIGRVCQIVATKVFPALARARNSLARIIPGTNQRAQAAAQAAQQRLQQSNLAQHPAGWNAINASKQARHVGSTATEGKGVLTANAERLFERYAGLGETVVGTRGQPGFKERISTKGGEIIGQHVDDINGIKQLTDSAIIHYGRTGSHIVPSAPSEAMLRMVPLAQ